MQTAKRWQLWTPRAHSSQSGKKYVVQKDKNLPARKRVVTKTAFKTKYIIFTDYFIMKLWIMFFTNLEMMEKNVFTNFESLGPFVLRIQSSCHLCLCHLQTRLLQLFKSSSIWWFVYMIPERGMNLLQIESEVILSYKRKINPNSIPV